MDGLLVVFKPKTYTSFDCVAILRKALGQKKIGHTGTLDPMAEGVLVCCAGKGTRIISYLEQDSKVYKGTLHLGQETDTDDICGEVIREAPEEVVASLTEEQILTVFSRYTGEIEQIPPAYAAIKVEGRKLYEYAREGKERQVPPRPVTIHDLVVTDISLPEISFRVHCSKGFYVRALCRDIGRELGTGGTMSSLRRTRAGAFTEEEALSIEEIKGMGPEELVPYLVPMEKALTEYPAVFGSPEEGLALIQGKPLREKGRWPEGAAFCRFFAEDTFIGMVRKGEGDTIRADKILTTNL